MSNELATQQHELDDRTLFSLVTDGDCARLSDGQKLAYYKARCDAAGLDYRAQPFQYIRLNNKLVLYALKACTDQLAGKHGIRCEIVDRSTSDGICIVTVRATTKDGRATDEIGAVSVKGLAGDALCNALMKASTKAKRRAVLAVCGLGMLDETELETIPGAQPALASAPTVRMPTRLSARVETSEAAEPEVEPEQPYLIGVDEPDLAQVLQASLEEALAPKIDESQRRWLMKLARENNHAPEAVKAWLARRGVSSSKLIPLSMWEFVRDRLASAEPLES